MQGCDFLLEISFDANKDQKDCMDNVQHDDFVWWKVTF